MHRVTSGVNTVLGVNKYRVPVLKGHVFACAQLNSQSFQNKRTIQCNVTIDMWYHSQRRERKDATQSVIIGVFWK